MKKRIRSPVRFDGPTEAAIEFGRSKVLQRIKVMPSGCWEWQGYRQPNGYGTCHWIDKEWRAHRLTYRLWKGEIPEGLDVCHSCDNKPCVNPEHLWLGDQRANSLDIVVKGQHYLASRETCPRGHSFAEHGRAHPRHSGWRVCRACDRGIQRMARGWPEDLAYSLPAGRFGQRPKEVTLVSGFKRQQRKQDRTDCVRGHSLSGENLYLTPDGRRQCRECHRMHVVKSAERRRSAHSAT